MSEATSSPLTATHGVVRGRSALIGLSHPIPEAGLSAVAVTIEAGVECSSGLTLRRIAGNLPDWPEAIYSVALPEGIVASIAIMHVELGSASVVAQGANYHLGKLLPRDRTSLGNHLYHKRSRISDAETLCYMLEQVLASDFHEPVDKFEAVKILSYRHLESLNQARIREVYRLVDEGLRYADKLKYPFAVARGARFQESRHQAIVSLRQVRWYAALMLGDMHVAEADAHWLHVSAPIANECPTVAYNSGMTVLAYGQALAEAGRHVDACAAFESVIALFRSAAAYMPSHPSTFREIGVSYEAAKAATEALRKVKGKPDRDSQPLTWARLASSFSRLRNPGAIDAYANGLERFVEYLRTAPVTMAFLVEENA